MHPGIGARLYWAPAADAAELETARQLQHHVPYSLHCSFVELRAFVARLRPRTIRGIVKGSNRGGGGGGGQAICVADCVAAAAKHRCRRVAKVAVTTASKRAWLPAGGCGDMEPGPPHFACWRAGNLQCRRNGRIFKSLHV